MGNFIILCRQIAISAEAAVASIRRQWRKAWQKGNRLVTGKTSAKRNGAQQDITDALDSFGIAWILFDEIEENPSVETVERAARLAIAEGIEFFIGIGGGSPMDSSKAIATMAAHPEQGTDASGMQKIRHCLW